MGRYRSRSRSYSPRRSPSPYRRERYDDPRDRYRDSRPSYRDRRSPAPSGLLVRNISLDARPEDLREPFERFGQVKDVYLPRNYYTGEARGFGFVKFRYAEDAAEAKDRLNHTIIGGREIRIVFAEENRKTPQEMRRTTRVSDHHGRRTPPRSSRRRYTSHSPSPSPDRRGHRDRRARDDSRSPAHSRSISRSPHSQDDRSATRSPPRQAVRRPSGDRAVDRRRSQSPTRGSRSFSKSRSRSYSP